MNHSTGSRAGIDVVLPVSEFPDWLNPVFVRDLRQGLRTSFFVWIFVLLHSLALVAAMGEWTVVHLFGGDALLFAGLFAAMTGLVFGFVLPLSLFHSLRPELGRGRNAELLLTSRLTRWEIVRGKLLVATTLSGLLLVSLLPYFLIRYFLGGVELFGLAWEIFHLLLGNAVMNAIVIGASVFESYIVRIVLIVGLMNWHIATVAAYTFRSGMTGAFSGTFSPELLAGQVLAGVLFVVCCLQLGRAKLQLSGRSADPVAKVLLFLFLIPIANGVILATSGALPGLLLLSVLLIAALRLDPDPRAGRKLSKKS